SSTSNSGHLLERHTRPLCAKPEVGGPHSITSSALISNEFGMVRPRALAVLRLTTNSNLVGCSTGRSDGFAPLRILSTYEAARRCKSAKFGPYDIRPPTST